MNIAPEHDGKSNNMSSKPAPTSVQEFICKLSLRLYLSAGTNQAGVHFTMCRTPSTYVKWLKEIRKSKRCGYSIKQSYFRYIDNRISMSIYTNKCVRFDPHLPINKKFNCLLGALSARFVLRSKAWKTDIGYRVWVTYSSSVSLKV